MHAVCYDEFWTNWFGGKVWIINVNLLAVFIVDAVETSTVSYCALCNILRICVCVGASKQLSKRRKTEEEGDERKRKNLPLHCGKNKKCLIALNTFDYNVSHTM